MTSHPSPPKPAPFREVTKGVAGWKKPIVAARHGIHLSSFHLSNLYSPLGTLSILVAVILYFSETDKRTMARHYQAWQVINTAQGKGGNGGRIDALQQLNADKVSLTGVDLSGAFLQGVKLDRANLVRANLHNADVRSGSLVSANLSDADLTGANLRNSDMRQAKMEGVDLSDADLELANLRDVDLSGATLEGVDLSGADLSNLSWSGIRSVKNANVAGVKNAPAGFVEWARKNGAAEVGMNQGQQVNEGTRR